MTWALNTATNYYDQVEATGGGGVPIPPGCCDPVIPQYDATFAYSAGDAVMFGDYLYYALIASTGVTPGTNPTVWEQVIPEPVIPQWESTHAYAINDQVSWNGIIYTAMTVNVNRQPDLNPSDWRGRDVFMGEWNQYYSYALNQIVNYGGVIYKAIAPSTGAQPDISPASWGYYVAPGAFPTEVLLGLIAGFYTYPLGGTPVYPNLTRAYINGVKLLGQGGAPHYTILGSNIILNPTNMGYEHETGYELNVYWQ